jgi:diaminopimelate epimerase
MLAVTKMHGACNDFIVVDLRDRRIGSLPEFARWACDRRAGIGADGVIAIERAAGGGLAMRTINADGSEAQMCGNGIRCAARWLDEAGEGAAIAFETAAGSVRTQILARGAEYQVRAEVGTPKIARLSTQYFGDGFAVDLGNPHAVFIRDRIDAIDLPAVAALVQSDAAFPEGANVHLATVESPQRLRLRFWERGVGLTPACGTGAVAAAAAAIELGAVAAPVEAHAPGGRLVVEWDGRGSASLTGPAVRVFDTEVPVDNFGKRQ